MTVASPGGDFVLDFDDLGTRGADAAITLNGACTGTDIFCPLTSQPGDTVRVTATFAP